MATGLVTGVDGKSRCAWGASTSDYVRYHDTEWGFPVRDDRRLFEKLCLEGFQAGLSWLTILRKREAFRKGFAGFEPAKVAKFGAREVKRLLRDPGIVRHRGKIESTINNARRALAIIEEHGSLASYLWTFEPKRPQRSTWLAVRARTQTAASRALSKDLKKRVGLVNDHVDGCFVRPAAAKAR